MKVVREEKITSFYTRGHMSQPPDGKGAPERRFCHNCGIPISIGVKFCSNCGTSQTMPGLHPLDVTVQLPATPATVVKGKRELGAMLIIVLLGFSAFAATAMVQLDMETR